MTKSLREVIDRRDLLRTQMASPYRKWRSCCERCGWMGPVYCTRLGESWLCVPCFADEVHYITGKSDRTPPGIGRDDESDTPDDN